MKKIIKKKVSKKITKKTNKKFKKNCNCISCSCRAPSGKSKESKVAKLKKLASINKNKKVEVPEKKGFFSWFNK